MAVLGCGTASDYTVEVFVHCELVAALVDELLHGVADMDLAGEDDEALQGTKPQGLLLILKREPGEEPVGVGQQQTVDTQVTAYGHQSVVLAQMGIGKPQVFI